MKSEKSMDSVRQPSVAKSERGLFTFLFLFIAVIAAALALGDPASTAWPLKCPLFQLTGYQCPLCGMQRMCHELMHLNFQRAFHYNAVLCITLPYWTVLVVGQMRPHLQSKGIVAFCYRNAVLLTAFGVMIVWGIVRNMNVINL